MYYSKLVLTIALSGLAATQIAHAQTATVFATGLSAPMKVIMTPEGNLLVSESTVAFNPGRVSIVDRSGARRPFLDGLPSGPTLGCRSLATSGSAVNIFFGMFPVPAAVSAEATNNWVL